MLTRIRWIAAAAAAIALASCSAVRPAPVVQSQALKMPPGTLKKVAVIPFSYKDTLPKYSGKNGTSPDTAAELVTRFLTDALAKRGITVIPASDFETAFTARGLQPTDLNPRTAAALAAREFGATAILIGEVSRYRDRVGESFGATTAASVAFNTTLYTAPAVQRVWSSKFDETQRALSENIVNARRYPGGGTRWLTAAELAQWGAESTVEKLLTSN
jgi:lipoprotein-anchoring transpeptidase ErfK/SrfK